MRIFKGIQSSLSSDGNQDTFFGKECDVTELSIDPSHRDNSQTEIKATIGDKEYREVRLVMDMMLFSQMFAFLINNLDYHGYGERDIQSLSEASDLLLSMKVEQVTT